MVLLQIGFIHCITKVTKPYWNSKERNEMCFPPRIENEIFQFRKKQKNMSCDVIQSKKR